MTGNRERNPFERFKDIAALELPDVYQFATLIVLAVNWNKDERMAWPSPDTIAKRAGMSERRVRYALRELEAAGRITSVGTRKGGRGKSIRYRLNLPSLIGNPAQRAAFPNQKPGTDEPETRHGTSLNPAQRAPEPLRTLYEPSAPAGARPNRAAPGARKKSPAAPAEESLEYRARRQLLEVAELHGWHREPGESDRVYLARVERLNQQRISKLQ